MSVVVFVETSILAVLLAGAGMLVYLRLRFAAHFAWAALITLGLDLSKTLGFLVLTGPAGSISPRWRRC